MAFFGRKPKKPGSVPGAASGGGREVPGPGAPSAAPGTRRGRSGRSVRSLRATRGERRAR